MKPPRYPMPSKVDSLTDPQQEDTHVERLLYTREEAAKLLHISRITLWRLTKRGAIRPTYTTRTPTFTPQELRRFITSRTKGAI